MGVELPFKSTMNFTYGEPGGMAPGVSRIVANNPSAFTFKGTNTYLVGSLSLAVIDPGPDDPDHIDAIMRAAGGRPITHIFVTHAHRDHVDGVARLMDKTGAVSAAFGRAQLHAPSELSSPVGTAFVDCRFAGDVMMEDGDVIESEDWSLEALHTPGHAPDHLCFALGGTGFLFSGDHVMSWNTTVIAPPEGSMADYVSSLELLLKRRYDVYLPGHGGRIDDPVRLVKAFLVHRRWRERVIFDAIVAGKETIPEIVGSVYRNLDRALMGAASASVRAHVELLVSRGEVVADGPLGQSTVLRAVT